MPAGCRAGYYARTIMTGFISSPYLEVRMQAGKPMFVCELLRQDLKIEMNALDRNRLPGSRSIWQW